MIFFDQFKVPTIVFGKCFAEFIIPIALLKEFGQFFSPIIEVISIRRCSGKANKFRDIIYTIRGTPRDIAIKEWDINNIKRKIIPFIIYCCRNRIIMNI